jgi:rRNA maturation RNase YbeY
VERAEGNEINKCGFRKCNFGKKEKVMISFHTEDIKFTLKNKTILKKWIVSTIEKKKRKAGDLNFIFCSDEHLLGINKQYLNHDTYTDIITFDYSKEDQKQPVSGDIFISVERVEENAKKFSKSFENELHRIIIHGTLHLLGYKDKTKSAKEEMTKEEDRSLKSLPLRH